jgi:hypothetical protein
MGFKWEKCVTAEDSCGQTRHSKQDMLIALMLKKATRRREEDMLFG